MTEIPHLTVIKCAMDGGEVRPPEKPGSCIPREKTSDASWPNPRTADNERADNETRWVFCCCLGI